MKRVVWLLVLLLAACTPEPTATLTHLPTASSTSALYPTPTPGLPATASPPPARLATPTRTPTPAPTLPTNTIVEYGHLPPSFSLTTYAEVFQPTSLTFGPDGVLYVASTNAVVYAFVDKDGDHHAETRTTFAWDVPLPLGLAWADDKLYISYTGAVQAVWDTNGNGERDRVQIILENLPNGRHLNDGLALGPDGYLYMGVGSTCDACREADPRSATILRFKPDGSAVSLYATGLRNPYDVAFNAVGDLFATDNGRDDLGQSAPPEELNWIVNGADYGWPDCWEGAPADSCAGATRAVAVFTARSSADGLVFYNGNNFPPEYSDNAFVAVFGSYVYPEIERGVRRVRLTKDGQAYTAQTDWFLKLDEGRPLDVTVGPDGGLYVADYSAGLIYRIVFGAP